MMTVRETVIPFAPRYHICISH